MKPFKVKLTPLANQNVSSLVDEICLYWSNKGNPVEGHNKVSLFLDEIESGLQYLSKNYNLYQKRGLFNGLECRYYPIQPSRNYAFLYSVDEKTSIVLVQLIAPCRGKYFNKFLTK